MTAKIEEKKRAIVKRTIGPSYGVLLILTWPSKIIFKEKKIRARKAVSPRTACLGKANWSVVKVEMAIGRAKNRIPSNKIDKFLR